MDSEKAQISTINDADNKKSGADAVNSSNSSSKKLRRRIMGGASAAIIASGLLISGLFGSREELMNNTMPRFNEPAIVQELHTDSHDDDTDDDKKKNPGNQVESSGLFYRIKQWIAGWPVVVKALMGIPLWGIGTAVTELAGVLFSAILSPVLAVILKWLVGFLALAAVFLLVMKLIFPDMPVKEILRPRNLMFLLIGAALLGISDHVLTYVWPDYARLRLLVLIIAGALILFIIGFIPALKRLKPQSLIKSRS